MENKIHRILVVLVAFMLVAASSFVLGKHIGAERQTWRSAVAAHRTAVDYCLALGEEVNKRITMAWRAQIPIAEFENQFGKAVPVDQGTFPEAKDDSTHVYTHEPSHRVFYLRFEHGVLVGVSSSHGSDDIQPHLPSIEEQLAAMR